MGLKKKRVKDIIICPLYKSAVISKHGCCDTLLFVADIKCDKQKCAWYCAGEKECCRKVEALEKIIENERI